MPDPNIPATTIYGPGTVPMRGLFSALAPNQLGMSSGAYKQLSNVRWGDNGVLQVRPGLVKRTSAAIQASSTVRGFKCLTFQGDAGRMFAAFKTNSTHFVDLYATNDATNFGSPFTQSSGQFGDTRLASNGSGDDYQTVFAVIHDPLTNLDVLIIQNGIDFPTTWDGTHSAKFKKITPPEKTSTWSSVPRAYDYAFVNDNSAVTASGSTTNWTINGSGGTVGDSFQILAITATTGFTGTRILDLGKTLTITNSNQLILTVEYFFAGQIEEFLAAFKIEAHGVQSGIYKPLYDPSQASNGTVGLAEADGGALGVGGYWHIALALDPMLAGTADSQIDKIQFTPITGAQVSAEFVASALWIFGIVIGGSYPGSSEFVISYYNPTSRSESASTVLPIRPRRLQDEGMPSRVGDVVWPVVDSLDFVATLWFSQIDQTQANTGVDRVNIYLSLPGEIDQNGDPVFTYLTFQLIATYTVSWVLTALGANGAIGSFVFADPSTRKLNITAPGALIAPIPIGRAMAVGTGSRLIVAGKSENQEAFPRVCLSRSGQGFRFAYAPDLTDPSTAYEDSVNGENIWSFISMAPSALGTASTYFMTDKGLWQVDPVSIGTAYFIRKVGPEGTNSPMSLSDAHGDLYFADIDRQIRNLRSGFTRPLSVGTISDKLATIPVARLLYTNGAWMGYRYYFAYTPVGGTTNTRILVWSERADEAQGAWESDDLLPSSVSAEYFAVQHKNTTSQTGAFGTVAPASLYFIGSDSCCYEYETGTTDLGSNIVIEILTGTTEVWEPGMTLGRFAVLSDPVNGGTLTATRYYWPSGGTLASTVTLSNANPYDYVVDNWGNGSTLTGAGLGVAGSLDITGSLPGGTKLWGMKINIAPRASAPRPTV